MVDHIKTLEDILKLRRGIRTIVATVITIAVIAPAASAVTVGYGTSASPQKVSGYGSTVQAYGSWVGYDRTAKTIYTGLDVKYKLTDADNHQAFTKFQISAKGRTSGASWKGGDDSSRENTVSKSWRTFSSPAQRMEAMNTNGIIDINGTYSTCIDIPLRSDPCTDKTFSTNF